MKHFRHAWILLLLFCVSTIPITLAMAENSDDTCIKCHQKISPGQVADWRADKHSREDVGCGGCHNIGVKTEAQKEAQSAETDLCGHVTWKSFRKFT